MLFQLYAATMLALFYYCYPAAILLLSFCYPAAIPLLSCCYPAAILLLQLYEIKDVITGKATTANVTQIARIRSVAPPAPEPPVVGACEKTWDRMEEGIFCVIWVKDEEKSVLRVLEVLELEAQSQYMLALHPQGLLLCVQPRAAARTTAARSRVGASTDATTQSDEAAR